MSDGSLSQDEIDALLQGGGGFDLGEAPPEQSPAPQAGLSDEERATFAAVLGELAATLASSLGGLVGTTVSMEPPSVELVTDGSFVASLPDKIVQTEVAFTGAAAGAHSFVFGPETATAIAGLMMGQEDVELNEAALSALEEAANTLTGAEATAFAERIGNDVGAAPGAGRTAAGGEVAVPDGGFLKAVYQVAVEGRPPAEMIEIFDLAVVRSLIGGAPQAAAGAAATPVGGTDMLGDMGFGGGGQDLLGGANLGFGAQPQAGPNVQSVQFPGLSGAAGAGQEQGNISLLMDVSMEMTVELGRTKKLIKDILGMGEGTIIELDKLAGEPVDILVNHKLIAKGEVVVIDENFGVRVTEIVDPMDRVPDM